MKSMVVKVSISSKSVLLNDYMDKVIKTLNYHHWNHKNCSEVVFTKPSKSFRVQVASRPFSV